MPFHTGIYPKAFLAIQNVFLQQSKIQQLTDKSSPFQLWKPRYASKWSCPNSTSTQEPLGWETRLFHTAFCRDPPWISPHVISATGVMICCFMLKSIFSIPKPLHRVRAPALQCFQLPHWPGEMRAVCNTTALEDYFPGVCLTIRHMLARREIVTVLLSDFQWSFHGLRPPPEAGQGSAQPWLAPYPISPSPPECPHTLPWPGYAVAGGPVPRVSDQLSG